MKRPLNPTSPDHPPPNVRFSIQLLTYQPSVHGRRSISFVNHKIVQNYLAWQLSLSASGLRPASILPRKHFQEIVWIDVHGPWSWTGSTDLISEFTRPVYKSSDPWAKKSKSSEAEIKKTPTREGGLSLCLIVMASLKLLSFCGLLSLAATVMCASTETHCAELLGTKNNPGLSCRHIRQNRNKMEFGDGIYFIRPQQSNGETFAVYCDMTTDNGGWTLVAVVANGDDQHWTFDDRHGDDGQRTSNWEAVTTIGELTSHTPMANKDFKSKAYYTVPAKEVLLTYKGENLARTTNSCLGAHTLRSLFNAYHFSCGGSNYNCHYGANKCEAAGARSKSSLCTHACPLAEQYSDDQESDKNQGIAAAEEKTLYLKTGEANGAEDVNKDRAYFSFAAARKTVSAPSGLGSFSRINNVVQSNDISIYNDASIRPSDKSRFYGIFVRWKPDIGYEYVTVMLVCYRRNESSGPASSVFILFHFFVLHFSKQFFKWS